MIKSKISDKSFIKKRLRAIFEDLMAEKSLERYQSPDSRTSQDKLKRKLYLRHLSDIKEDQRQWFLQQSSLNSKLWNYIFNMLKEGTYQPKFVYKLCYCYFFKNYDIKAFSDNKNGNRATNRLNLKDTIQSQRKCYWMENLCCKKELLVKKMVDM